MYQNVVHYTKIWYNHITICTYHNVQYLIQLDYVTLHSVALHYLHRIALQTLLHLILHSILMIDSLNFVHILVYNSIFVLLNFMSIYVHLYADVYIIINHHRCNLISIVPAYLCIQGEDPISEETHHEAPGYQVDPGLWSFSSVKSCVGWRMDTWTLPLRDSTWRHL